MCLCLCGVKLSFFLVALPKKKGKRFHGNLITRMILVGKKNIPPQREISVSQGKKDVICMRKGMQRACMQVVQLWLCQ